MTEETIISPEDNVSAVVENTPIVEPVIEDKVYEYQPTDEDGRPIGGKQVIKYKTEAELRDKLTQQSIHQIRKMREQQRKLQLGIVDQEAIEDSAPRFKTPLEFKPQTLSNDERFQLAQDILDPEKFDTATARIVEATYGVTGEQLRSTLTDLQAQTSIIQAQREVDKFKAKNPAYIVCPENFTAITGWMSRHDLAPVESNFQKAYDTLLANDVLVTSQEIIRQELPVEPVIQPVVIVDEPVVEERIIEQIPIDNQIVPEPVIPRVEPVRVPTGLNRNNSSDAGMVRPIGDEIVYEFIQRDDKGRQIGESKIFKGQAALNAMPADEYKRRLLSEKGFAQKVDKTEAETAKRRRG